MTKHLVLSHYTGWEIVPFYGAGKLRNEQLWGKSVFTPFNLIVSTTLSRDTFIISSS